MDFWIVVIVIVAITAGSSMVTSIVSAIKPKIKQKDLDELKAQIKRELRGGDDITALPEYKTVNRRLNQLEEQVGTQDEEIRHLNEENTFLKRLLDKN